MLEYLFGGLTTLGIVAQILSLVGNMLFTGSSFFKNKKLILILQSINHVLSSIAEIIQKLYSGVVQEATSLTRNIILMFVKEEKKILKLIIIIVITTFAVVIGVIVNVLGSGNKWQGYLPISATIIYTIFLILAFTIKVGPLQSEMLIKLGLFLSSICWAVYGVADEGKLYAITVFNGITIISCFISFMRISKIHYRIRKHELTYTEANEFEIQKENEKREKIKEKYRKRKAKKMNMDKQDNQEIIKKIE